MPDGGLVRDALAADPEGWLGAAHAARFGAEPRAAGQAAGRRRAPARPPPPRPPVRARAPRAGLRQDRGVDRPRGARRARRWRVGWRDDVAADTLRGWVDAQDHDALLGALNPVPVSAGDAVFVPAGVPHAIGDGILIAELQEPTDLSILLEWDGFGIDDEQAATLGLGWDVALASVERTARDPSALLGPPGRRRRLRAPARGRRAPSSPPSASRPRAAPWSSPAGFAVVLVVEGAGTLAGLEVTRGDALLVPHAAGPVDARWRPRGPRLSPPGGAGAVTELLLGIDVGTSACKAAVVDARGVELAHGQVPTPWEPRPDGSRARRRHPARRRGRRGARGARARARRRRWPASA